MTEQLITDWIQFKEGKSFENGHFYTLFMEANFDQIEEIYKFFRSSSTLTLKMKNYHIQKKISIGSKSSPELLDVLIKLDFDEKKSLFMNHSVFKKLLRKWEFVYLDDFKKVEEMSGSVMFQTILSHFHLYFSRRNEKLVHAIYDALYGLTSDFDMQLYLFSPLLDITYSGEYMFQFKKLGGVYAINDKDNIVYYSSRHQNL